MNPAGGIKRFVESHVPFVEEAIIVDTGSIDGTREILEELESKYPNLKIYDLEFKGFANARNYSLEKAKTKYRLILDADELLTSKRPTNDWKIIRKYLLKKDLPDIYTFNFKHILPSGKTTYVPQQISRLLIDKDLIFLKEIWESLDISCVHNLSRIEKVEIKHFLPTETHLLIKDFF